MTIHQVAIELDLFPEEIANYEEGTVAAPAHLLPELCSLFAQDLRFWLDETGYVTGPRTVKPGVME